VFLLFSYSHWTLGAVYLSTTVYIISYSHWTLVWNLFEQLSSTLCASSKFWLEHYLHKHVPHSLVFCAPLSLLFPTPVNIMHVPLEFNVGPLSLFYSVEVNSGTLSYEEWLYNTLISTQNTSSHPKLRVRLKAKALQVTATNEMLSLYEARHKEWMRQYAILTEQGSHMLRQTTKEHSCAQCQRLN